MIYYSIPYNADKNLGIYYNQFLKILPSPDDFACFVDGDATFTTTRFGSQIEAIVASHPECGLFYSKTNRVACQWQLCNQTMWKSNDIKVHRDYGKDLAMSWFSTCRSVAEESTPGSGVLMLLRKSLWEEIGPFHEKGMSSIDWDYFRRVKKAGHPILLMEGVYLYHWYRGGNRKSNYHLM